MIDEGDLVGWLDGQPVVVELDENEFLVLFHGIRPTVVQVSGAEQVFSEIQAVFDLGANGKAAKDGILEGRESVGIAIPELGVLDSPIGFWVS